MERINPSPPQHTSISVEKPELYLSHEEHLSEESGWKLSKKGDGDVALALFSNPDERGEEVDPVELERIIGKIDWMILPYLAVCYIFFFVDKTTLSYAAIFRIEEDLHLHGTQYSCLSSASYFGLLAWAFPTNILLQHLPIPRYLGTQIFLWGFFLLFQAACNSLPTLALVRVLAGAAEACADPAFMLITQIWYGAIVAIAILICVLGNDRFTNKRCLFPMLFMCPNIAAFGLHYVSDRHRVGRLVRYYLTGPYNAAFAMLLGINIGNTAGHTKKVITNAAMFLGYCTGNLLGPFFFKTHQSPTYNLGIWMMITCHLTEVALAALLWALLAWENRRRDRKQWYCGRGGGA